MYDTKMPTWPQTGNKWSRGILTKKGQRRQAASCPSSIAKSDSLVD